MGSDRKLNWKTPVEDRIRKATTAFFTCKRLFGRISGLRHQMVYWLCIGIERAITYFISMVDGKEEEKS